MNAPVVSRTAAYGIAVLRISLGVLFLVHGLTKLLVFTPAAPSATSSRWAYPAGWPTWR